VYEQVLLGLSGSGAKKEGELAVTSQEFEFHLPCPLWLPVKRAVSFELSTWSGNECQM